MLHSAPRLRLGIVLWLAGMTGVVAVATLVMARLADGWPGPKPLPVSTDALVALALGQGAVFLGLAVWAGVALAPKVGLRAPLFEALVGAGAPQPAPWAVLLPGILGGVAGALLLGGLTALAPAELAAAAARFPMPLAARLLYGGITEELLLRWGFLSLLAWGFFRLRSGPAPTASVTPAILWVSIAISALLFGLGHLPAAEALAGKLTSSIVCFVVLGNAAFGLLAGWLFWRHGLEAAMLAHALAHLLSFLALG